MLFLCSVTWSAGLAARWCHLNLVMITMQTLSLKTNSRNNFLNKFNIAYKDSEDFLKLEPRSRVVIKLSRPSGKLRVINSNFGRKKGKRIMWRRGKLKVVQNQLCSETIQPGSMSLGQTFNSSSEFQHNLESGCFLTTCLTFVSGAHETSKF